MLFKNAKGAVVVVSLVDDDSLNNINEWFEKIERMCVPSLPVSIVVNKLDFYEENQSEETKSILEQKIISMQKYADEKNARFYTVCSNLDKTSDKKKSMNTIRRMYYELGG